MKKLIDQFAITKPDSSRRQFLNGCGHMAMLTASSGFLSGNAISDDQLYRSVAAVAKELAAGKVDTLRMLVPQGCEANLQPVITSFRSLTGIAIELVSTDVDEINTRLLLDAMSNSGTSDLALPATFGIPELVAAGAIVPITEYASRYEPANYRDEFLFNGGDDFDSELYGFGTDGDTYTMFYLRKLLENAEEQARYSDKFGQSLGVPITWEELDRQIEYFDRPEEGLSGGLLFRIPGYLAWEWWVRYHAKGYWPLSDNMEPQINCDAGVEALEEMQRVTQFLAPETKSLGLVDNWKKYSEGNVYCNIGWGGTQKFLNKPPSRVQGKMLFGPTPGGMLDNNLLVTPFFNWGWSYVVSQNSKYPEIAYLFGLFASTPQMSTAAVREADGFFDPYRPEHYQDVGIQNTYSNEFLQMHEVSMRKSIPNLYLENHGQYFRTLNDGLDEVIIRNADPRKTLDRVALQWESINNHSDLNTQIIRWRELKQKYPTSIKTRLKDV